jgi:CheY-like chemotaxis protein
VPGYLPTVLDYSRTVSDQPTVLIVDDHQDSVALYALALPTMGLELVTAATAEEAFARTCELHPDVIVADIALPGESGLELTRRLRQDARTKDTRIIVLTAHARASFEQQAYEARCDRFVEKPCLPDTLAVEIRTVLASCDTGFQRQAGALAREGMGEQ